MGIKNTRDHYARKNFYVVQPVTVPIRTFHPTTWLSDRRNKNACDSPFEAEKQDVPWMLRYPRKDHQGD